MCVRVCVCVCVSVCVCVFLFWAGKGGDLGQNVHSQVHGLLCLGFRCFVFFPGGVSNDTQPKSLKGKLHTCLLSPKP